MSQTLVPTLSLFLLQKTKYVYLPQTPQCSTSHSCAYSLKECSSKLSTCLSKLDEKCITTWQNENKLRTLTYSVITDMFGFFSDCQNNAEILSLFFHLLEQPVMIQFYFLSKDKAKLREALTGSVGFPVGRREGRWPLARGGAEAFGSVLLLPFLWRSICNQRSLHKPNCLTASWWL